MEGGHHPGEKRPALAPSRVQLCWVIKGKKNEPLYLSGAGQESSAAFIKILSSPVKDIYRSSSATRSLFVKENQLNRWGLSFHSSCKSPRLPPGSLKTSVGGSQGTPSVAGEGLRNSVFMRGMAPLLQGMRGRQWLQHLEAVAPGMTLLQRGPGSLNSGVLCCAAWGQGGI